MKQKQKRKHLESPYSPPAAKKSRANMNLQEDLQRKHKAVASASAQAARRASSSSSEYFCISSEEKLSVAGISKLRTCDPPPGCSFEDSPLVSEARSGSSESEYFSCYSSLYHLSSAEVLNTDEDIPLPGPSGLAQGHGQTAEDSDSNCVSSADKFIHSGMWWGRGEAEGESGREDCPRSLFLIDRQKCTVSASLSFLEEALKGSEWEDEKSKKNAEIHFQKSLAESVKS
ncbi:uncharacterized protein LOC118017085 [Mirounga leonina]|uniref:uncharacterized protein LOC118017085 n=1 Tax=Mirounga leonina TaxID=9715 RepID=UPI00156BE612|nr:uncharacterized protein LOC118017085 [Mirounga leonina]